MNIINIKDKSHKLYYVGGIVRDELLNIDSLDIDLVYEGNAIDFAKGNNFEILQTNEPFGTVRVLIDNQEIDIASTRTECYPQKGHLPVVKDIACTLKDDVLRRDFTINSLYKSVYDNKIVDFTNGLEDLRNKKLKVLHENSFVDDPTRIIRGLKFRIRFDFELEENTKQLQEDYLENINYDMCYKRIKKEIEETFNPKIEISKLKKAYEIFYNENICKLISDTKKNKNINDFILKTVEQHLPQINCLWIIFAYSATDIENLPLAKTEMKIIEDLQTILEQNFQNDFEIFKAFETCEIETIILYGIFKDENIIRHYLENLKNIKIFTTGNDLINMGYNPSPKFKECFDYLLKEKINNPNLTKEEELKLAQNFFEN